jgi:NHL repeat
VLGFVALAAVIGALAAPSDVALGPRGSVYATSGSRVVRFSAAHAKRVVARGLRSPIGLAVTANGSFYVSDSERNRVLRYATGKRKVIASKGLDQPLGIAIGADRAVYVADSHHGRVVRVRSGGRLEPVVRGLGLPVALTTEPGGSLLIVDHVAHDRPGTILRRMPDGTLHVLSSGAISAVTSAAAVADGTTYATSFLPPYLGRLDATGKLQATDATLARLLSCEAGWERWLARRRPCRGGRVGTRRA